MSLIDSKKHFIVVNFPHNYHAELDDFHEDIIICCHQMFKGVKYIGILHDLDRDDDGELKTIHYHIYFEFPKKVTTQNIIRNFSEYFELDMKNCISDERVYSSVSCVRYLLHLDDRDKILYEADNLFFSSSSMLKYLDKEIEGVDFDTLLEIINSSNSVVDVYSHLSLSDSARYRWLIRDIWQEKLSFIDKGD